jgi:hypothetical protein
VELTATTVTAITIQAADRRDWLRATAVGSVRSQADQKFTLIEAENVVPTS